MSSVRVYLARPVPASDVDALLDADDRAMLTAVPHAGLHAQRATARALLRSALAEELGTDEVRVDRACLTCGGPHGKPIVRDQSIHVSVAHTDGLVLVAVSNDAELGIDVEALSAFASNDIDRAALTPVEALAVAALPPQHRAAERARLWTRKEAVAKVSGIGLRVDPRVDQKTDCAQVHDLDVGPGFAASLAIATSAHVDVQFSDASLPTWVAAARTTTA